jgi:hypothetical protein
MGSTLVARRAGRMPASRAVAATAAAAISTEGVSIGETPYNCERTRRVSARPLGRPTSAGASGCPQQ